jgi:chromosome segregation ATPase
MKKYVNGILSDCSAEEIQQYNEDLSNAKTVLTDFEVRMLGLREYRNNLLSQTDYLALSDQTMSAEMTTYRQALRDITNGLTTVEDVEAVVFPERPEA